MTNVFMVVHTVCTFRCVIETDGTIERGRVRERERSEREGVRESAVSVCVCVCETEEL